MSDTFEWRDEYSVGIDILDAQHKYMFEQGNSITAVHPEETQKLIVNLYRYVMQHFATEEAHMRAIGYPLAEEHLQQHEFIIEQLNDISTGFEPTAHNTTKLKVFFLNWLTTHILQEDKKYFEFSRTTPSPLK